MPRVYPTKWTDEDRAFVGDLLRQGFTCSGLADVLGMSRNQVAGRVNRDEQLKACRPPKGSPLKRTRRRVADEPKKPLAPPLNIGRVAPNDPMHILERAGQLAARRAMAEASRGKPGPKPMLPRRTPRPAMRLVPLVDLNPRECRWPVEEDHSVTGHFLFCGAAAANDIASYCQHHIEAAAPGRSNG